jgi:hypothetical protein
VGRIPKRHCCIRSVTLFKEKTMSNLSGFNANDVPESTYGAMPPGLYAVMATASDRKTTKAGTGEYLQFTLDVLDEAYNTKKLWARLNLWNPNPTAVSIAQQELAGLCKAVGVLTPEDSSELLNVPFIVKLGVEKDGKGGEQNRILNYYSIAAAQAMGDAAPAATTPAATQQTAAPTEGKKAPVWNTAAR